jgi:hypothetical protein
LLVLLRPGLRASSPAGLSPAPPALGSEFSPARRSCFRRQDARPDNRPGATSPLPDEARCGEVAFAARGAGRGSRSTGELLSRPLEGAKPARRGLHLLSPLFGSDTAPAPVTSLRLLVIRRARSSPSRCAKRHSRMLGQARLSSSQQRRPRPKWTVALGAPTWNRIGTQAARARK